MAGGRSVRAGWLGRRRALVEVELTDDQRLAVRDVFFDGDRRPAYVARFFALLVLSTVIAALGLLLDSVAVIVGAMLVAPLMTPILAAGAAVVLGDLARLVRSLGLLAVGTAVAVALGWIVAVVAGAGLTPDDLPAEITGRTQPGLLDLGVAVAAGAAGGYVMTRPEASGALPGVGIAVALVPPLATTGIVLRLGSFDAAWGSFLLFLTNLAAIVLSGAVVLLVSGFVTGAILRRRVTAGLLGVAVSVAAVAVPLTLHTRSVILDELFRRDVVEAIRRWDPTVRIVQLDADRSGGRGTVDALVAGPNDALLAWRLAEEIAREVDLELDVRVSHQLLATSQASTR